MNEKELKKKEINAECRSNRQIDLENGFKQKYVKQKKHIIKCLHPGCNNVLGTVDVLSGILYYTIKNGHTVERLKPINIRCEKYNNYVEISPYSIKG